MPVSQVIFQDSSLIDLTNDTVTAGDVREGISFHSADGSRSIGTMNPGGGEDENIDEFDESYFITILNNGRNEIRSYNIILDSNKYYDKSYLSHQYRGKEILKQRYYKEFVPQISDPNCTYYQYMGNVSNSYFGKITNIAIGNNYTNGYRSLIDFGAFINIYPNLIFDNFAIIIPENMINTNQMFTIETSYEVRGLPNIYIKSDKITDSAYMFQNCNLYPAHGGATYYSLVNGICGVNNIHISNNTKTAAYMFANTKYFNIPFILPNGIENIEGMLMGSQWYDKYIEIPESVKTMAFFKAFVNTQSLPISPSEIYTNPSNNRQNFYFFNNEEVGPKVGTNFFVKIPSYVENIRGLYYRSYVPSAYYFKQKYIDTNIITYNDIFNFPNSVKDAAFAFAGAGTGIGLYDDNSQNAYKNIIYNINRQNTNLYKTYTSLHNTILSSNEIKIQGNNINCTGMYGGHVSCNYLYINGNNIDCNFLFTSDINPNLNNIGTYNHINGNVNINIYGNDINFSYITMPVYDYNLYIKANNVHLHRLFNTLPNTRQRFNIYIEGNGLNLQNLYYTNAQRNNNVPGNIYYNRIEFENIILKGDNIILSDLIVSNGSSQLYWDDNLCNHFYDCFLNNLYNNIDISHMINSYSLQSFFNYNIIYNLYNNKDIYNWNFTGYEIVPNSNIIGNKLIFGDNTIRGGNINFIGDNLLINNMKFNFYYYSNSSNNNFILSFIGNNLDISFYNGLFQDSTVYLQCPTNIYDQIIINGNNININSLLFNNSRMNNALYNQYSEICNHGNQSYDDTPDTGNYGIILNVRGTNINLSGMCAGAANYNRSMSIGGYNYLRGLHLDIYGNNIDLSSSFEGLYNRPNFYGNVNIIQIKGNNLNFSKMFHNSDIGIQGVGGTIYTNITQKYTNNNGLFTENFHVIDNSNWYQAFDRSRIYKYGRYLYNKTQYPNYEYAGLNINIQANNINCSKMFANSGYWIDSSQWFNLFYNSTLNKLEDIVIKGNNIDISNMFYGMAWPSTPDPYFNTYYKSPNVIIEGTNINCSQMLYSSDSTNFNAGISIKGENINCSSMINTITNYSNRYLIYKDINIQGNNINLSNFIRFVGKSGNYNSININIPKGGNYYRMFGNIANISSTMNIYFKGNSLDNKTGMFLMQNISSSHYYNITIFCNNVELFTGYNLITNDNNTTPLQWDPITNGIRNYKYNIYIYNNYE